MERFSGDMQGLLQWPGRSDDRFSFSSFSHIIFIAQRSNKMPLFKFAIVNFMLSVIWLFAGIVETSDKMTTCFIHIQSVLAPNET